MSKSIQQKAPPSFESIFDGNSQALKPEILARIPKSFHPEIATIVSIVLQDTSPDSENSPTSLRGKRLLDMQYAAKKEKDGASELTKQEAVMRILWNQAGRRRAINNALAKINESDRS